MVELLQSSSQIYRNVQEIVNVLSQNLSAIILSRVARETMLQDAIGFDVFRKECNLLVDSTEWHVFLSVHYRQKVFEKTVRHLRNEGYECTIEMDDGARLRKIKYDVRVLSPLRKYSRYLYAIVLPVVLTYAVRNGVDYVNEYIRRRQDEKW